MNIRFIYGWGNRFRVVVDLNKVIKLVKDGVNNKINVFCFKGRNLFVK